MRLCGICGRASRGFFYTHELKPDRFPTYAFCAKRCLDAGAAIAKRNHGVIDKTAIEVQAVKAARRHLADVLTDLGLMRSFHDRTPE